MTGYLKKWTLIVISALCIKQTAPAAPTATQIRTATIDYLTAEQQDAGIKKMTDYLSRRITKVSRVPSREMHLLSTTAECVALLKQSKQVSLDKEIAQWILASDERLHLFVDVVDSKHDDVPRVMQILSELKKQDPDGVEHYFDLALAIAVVMDKPVRKMHSQMGKDLLVEDKDPAARFHYFKTLFQEEIAKIDYTDLSVHELIFVVHVPVPQAELEWALKHANGNLKRWGERYQEIVYDRDRLDNSQFVWNNGTYTLDAIQRYGGICVDQAYFSVMTGRAFGIPCLYFRGIGQSCNHAWFAFMEKPGKWHLGIGRYDSEYTTGFAVNPQTNQQMTDHDVAYTCEHSLQSGDAARAQSNLILARVLQEKDPASALKCAREARTLVKRLLPAWQIEQQLLIQQKQYNALEKQFALQKDVFRKYPYILSDSAQKSSHALQMAGHPQEAKSLMKSLSGVLGEDQEDLTYSMELVEIDRLVADGELKKACRELEQMMERPEYGGNKSFGLIKKYLTVTQQAERTREAVKFLEKYVDDLVATYSFPSTYEAHLWTLMQRAYTQNKDTQRAAAVAQKIKDLRNQ